MGTETQGSEGNQAAGKGKKFGLLDWRQLMHRAKVMESYTWLDSKRWFRPVLMGWVACAVGLLLTPDLIVRSYATDSSSVGMPATENIKAPYELDVPDEEATGRMRDEAEAQVRRVYDFDATLGDKASERITHAFITARERMDGATDTTAMTAARAEFEKNLGVTVKAEEYVSIRAARFSAETEQALRRLVLAAQAHPIVATSSTLEAERDLGISMQRVPADGKPSRLVDDIDGISDLDSARQDMGMRAPKILQSLSPEVPATLRVVITAVALRMMEPSLTPNRAETETQRSEARAAVKPVTISVKKGEMVIRDGERFTKRHLLVLSALHESGHGSTMVLMGVGGVVLLLALIMMVRRVVHAQGGTSVEMRARDLIFLAVMFVGGLGIGRLGLLVARALHDSYPSIPLEAFLFTVPVAAGAMVVRLVLRAEVALLFSLVGSIMLGLLADGDRLLSIYALVGTVAGTSAIRTISARSDLLRAGVAVGVAQVGTALGVQLFLANAGFGQYLWVIPGAFASGIMAGVVALALTPAIEWAFNYTTDLKLLELANLNHPALKELIVQAPGSYHHSIIVGALVEAAAESIGANPLLARVMAYYHDLGKGCNPGYFVENQRTGQNPHDKLKPSMSAMIIRRHVTDGIEMAKQYGLGEQILAGIAEHHGTTLIHYFYHKAKEQAEEGQHIAEADYRYPGQKPQTREAALVMLGDSIEAASRSLSDPTPARLQGLVNRIISHKFTDEQLEECDLTLRDLHTIAKCFSRVLNSIYHHRVEYPEMLKDISGKKQNADSDTKSPKRPEGGDNPDQENPPDNLRRLGL